MLHWCVYIVTTEGLWRLGTSGESIEHADLRCLSRGRAGPLKGGESKIDVLLV